MILSPVNKTLLDECYKLVGIFKGGHVAKGDADGASGVAIHQVYVVSTYMTCLCVCVCVCMVSMYK